MSSTDNENGPFIIFFLPAVVGCLTILVARRWVSAQASIAVSKSVSRRRKILRDPPVKRALPVVTKMLPQTGKKASASTKKAFQQNYMEDDVNSSTKRLGRPNRGSPSSTSVQSDVKSVEDTIPKHIPYPHMPQDGELMFETMTFIFTSVALALQFLNMYRTVWWLPNSYNNHTMHFYLIDPHLVVFILMLLARRLLLTITITILEALFASKIMPNVASGVRMFILGLVLGVMAWCVHFISLKFSAPKIFVLAYPIAVYFFLFGFDSRPFLEMQVEAPPLHSCSTDPHAVRNEVELMRRDFNGRLKKIIFGSVIGAYYTSFVPCVFAETHLYYDVYGAVQHIAFVLIGMVGRLTSQLVSGAYCDVMHRAAVHLGSWQEDRSSGADVTEWSPNRLWTRGARVVSRGVIYQCRSFTAAADPQQKKHKRFYMLFRNPATFLCALLCLHLSLIVVQLCLLFSPVIWHTMLSLSILLFINYYTLFKITRDYLVAFKVYRAERIIKDI